MDDCLRVGKLSHYVTNHPGQLSLAIPLWVCAMSTGDGYGRRYREENGEFYVAVAPATSTACTQLVKGAGCQIEPAIQPIWVIYWLNWI